MSCAGSARLSLSSLRTTCIRRCASRGEMSSEIAPHYWALLARDQVLLGRQLACLLGLRQLGHVAAALGRVGCGLILSAVRRPNTWAVAEPGRHLPLRAGGVEPLCLVREHVRIGARADATAVLRP